MNKKVGRIIGISIFLVGVFILFVIKFLEVGVFLILWGIFGFFEPQTMGMREKVKLHLLWIFSVAIAFCPDISSPAQAYKGFFFLPLIILIFFVCLKRLKEISVKDEGYFKGVISGAVGGLLIYIIILIQNNPDFPDLITVLGVLVVISILIVAFLIVIIGSWILEGFGFYKNLNV